MADTTLWGVHGGRTGDADTLFLKGNCIALGWHEMGDLSLLNPDRDAFKARIAEVYPGKKSGAIPVDAGQLFRFVHEVRVGELVAYPSRSNRQVHLGRIEGQYKFEPDNETTYPHRRRVTWLREVPRTRFSLGALAELGAAMSLFQIKNYADEFRAALEGQPMPAPVAGDETVALVADEIEETTRDFILKTLAQELKGHPFAEFTAHLLGAMGYRTRLSPEGPDGGVDIVAHEDELGFKPPIVKVQVKSTEGSTGDPVVSALYGKLAVGEFALVVTLGTFTNQARTFARSKANLRLIDGEVLIPGQAAHLFRDDGAPLFRLIAAHRSD